MEGREFLEKKDAIIILDKEKDTIIPGFCEKIVGTTKDKFKNFNIILPDEYSLGENETNIGGKEASFKVTVTEIKERLYQHWNEGEIVEMLGVISLFGYLNRWNDSMGTSIETGAVESADQYLGKHGWEKGKHDGSVY